MPKPIWFVFPGLEAFDSSPSSLSSPHFVKLCDSLYERIGVNLIDSIVQEGSSPSIATVFATVTALQCSLVNLLSDLGLSPTGYIGYGIGEIACSYIDGCYDAVTAVTLSYTIGKKIDESGSRRGAMALVYQNESEFKSFFSNSGVSVSAHNTDDSITISGSQKNVLQVMEKLKLDKVKSSLLSSYSIALHCQQMDYLTETALESLYRLIDSPKPRSSRWVSTTVPPTEDCLRLSCPRYFLRNLTSPVLFREACIELPSDAIVIEVTTKPLLEQFVKTNQPGVTHLTVSCVVDNMATTDNSVQCMADFSTDKLVDYLQRETRSSGIYSVR